MAETRAGITVTGAEARDFLQGLVTNDVAGLDHGLVYAAMLTPQGKYRADFFLVPRGDGVLIDLAALQADDIFRALMMYKLRSPVHLSQTDLQVTRGAGPAPSGAFADPRDPAMGWRGYDGQPGDDTDWTARRVAALVPEAGIELHPDSYILEAGFERLNGVDFRKGCYVGQEVTARMKHKTELKKGLARVTVTGEADPGTPIERDGKAVGVLHSRAGDTALAYLRFDRAGQGMRAGAARVDYSA